MTANEYQKAALRTARTDELPIDMLMLNAALGLNGEAGEVADIIKKTWFQGHELDRNHLVEEAGDCCWYVSLLCYALGIDLESVFELNIRKLMKRYPDGFSSERSVNREN